MNDKERLEMEAMKSDRAHRARVILRMMEEPQVNAIPAAVAMATCAAAGVLIGIALTLMWGAR